MNFNLEVIPLPLLKKNGSGMQRCLDIIISADELVRNQNACLKIFSGLNSVEYPLGELNSRVNRKEIFIPEVVDEEKMKLLVTYGNQKALSEVKVKPARKWVIYLVLHSHTDLGFTAPVSEVAQIHNDNTDLAILYCKETQNWLEGSRFKWTCEVSWQVQNYLRDRSSVQFNELINQVNKGNIDVGALYSGELTEILGHEQAARSFYFAADLRRKYNIPIDTAMLCDVPGCTKGFVQVMAKSGIKNFILADNNFIAPFLQRTDLPRPFFWCGDNNSKVLTWYTDHPFFAYIEGQNYGLSESYSESRKKLPFKLLDLEKSGYEYDEFQLQYAFDNFRIEFRPAAVVKEWNEQWEYPKIKLSTAREFLNGIRTRYADMIPEIKGDWQSWWSGITTGFPYETSKSRYLHNIIPALEILSSSVNIVSDKVDHPLGTFKKLYDDTLAFDEHSGSGLVWEAKSKEQQEKALREGYGFLYDAIKNASETKTNLTGELSSLIKNKTPHINIGVFNSLNHQRSGFVRTSIDFPPPFYLRDKIVNKNIPVKNINGTFEFFAEDLPSAGFKLFEVIPGISKIKPQVIVSEDDEYVFAENYYYRIKVNRKEGKISSVYCKKFQKELIKADFNLPLVYELKPEVAIEMGKYKPEIYNGDEVPGEVKDISQWITTETKLIKDDVVDFIIQTVTKIGGKSWLTWNIYLKENNIHIENNISGNFINDREVLVNYLSINGMLYFRFNFNLNEASVKYETPCAITDPLKDPFMGSCKDYSAVQNWIQFTGKEMAVTFMSVDAPLLDLGGIALHKYRNSYPLNLQDVYVRVCSLNEFNLQNKSPYTNNPDLIFRFIISTGSQSPNQIGQNNNCELIPFVVRPGSNGLLEENQFTFIKIIPDKIQLMTVKMAEERDGIIIRVRETEGSQTGLKISIPAVNILKAYRTMITEEIIEQLNIADHTIKYSLDPYSIETFKIKLR